MSDEAPSAAKILEKLGGVARVERVEGKPDVSGWTFPSAEKLHALVTDMASEALDYALASENTYAFWPAVWGPESDGLSGKGVADPLTIYLRIDLADSESAPTVKFSLRHALASSMEDCADDGSFSDALADIRDALHKLADDVNHCLPKNKKRRARINSR